VDTFRHPTNGHTERVGPAWLWALLFGVFYFAWRGMWTHAIIGAILAFLTFGISWVIYAIAAPSLVRKHYLRAGWVPIT
jgi:hypothetical protein